MRVVLEAGQGKAKPAMTLRVALVSLISIFGLGLLVLVTLNGIRHLSDLQTYRAERSTEQTRQAVRTAMLETEVAAHRLGFAFVTEPTGNSLASVDLAIRHLRQAVALSVERTDVDWAPLLQDSLTTAERVRAELAAAGADTGAHTALRRELRTLAERLRLIRSGVVGSMYVTDVQMAMLHLIRDLTVDRHAEVALIAESMADRLAGQSPDPATPPAELESVLARLSTPAPSLLLAVDLRVQQPTAEVEALTHDIRTIFIPRVREIFAMLDAGQQDPALLSRLMAEADQREALVRAVFAKTDEIAMNHIETRIAVSGREAMVALVIGVAVVALYLVSVVAIARRVVQPLVQLRDLLVRLSEGDLRPIPHLNTGFVDLRAVNDALRIFRVDALRRERWEREKQELAEDLMKAFREMRADLEAAAHLQTTQLPTPGVIGPFRFARHFRASRQLGGDSFDYFQLPDGRIALFQLDVSGKGTAASLVAVAAHTTMKRSLMTIAPDKCLAATMNEVNAQWSEELPYFTAILLVFDPAGQVGRIVQAGHPCPILVPASGDLQKIGNGGLPVGVHLAPDYEELSLPMTVGDRLFIFSDGIYEVPNPAGEMFGEDRLYELISQSRHQNTDWIINRIISALKVWAVTHELEDDVSLVVMERF